MTEPRRDRSAVGHRPRPVRDRYRTTDHLRRNLELWERQSASYDARFRRVLGGRHAMAWGFWRLPETNVRLLGGVRGTEILELGCGAARWSRALARRGARVVGLDLSPEQLARARAIRGSAGARVELVRGDAERLPFRASRFDRILSDWGALTFADPTEVVPECARVLRPGGRLVFATASPISIVARDVRRDRPTRRLLRPYFGLRRVDLGSEVTFQLPYGAWIELFRRCGLAVERLAETRAPRGVRSAYLAPGEEAWARRWPIECIWSVRRLGRRAAPRARPAGRTRRGARRRSATESPPRSVRRSAALPPRDAPGRS
jgi:ubiquinone/menaquinone biosynthesis C-methylase UbiE